MECVEMAKVLSDFATAFAAVGIFWAIAWASK